jgi:hypothetical protein
MTRREAEFWRSVIRIFATVAALFGLILCFNEMLENIVSCQVGTCQPIHVSTMLWGIGFLVGGCLVIQRGDVSMSLREFTDAGERIRGWFGRRSYDRAPEMKEITKVEIIEDDGN